MENAWFLLTHKYSMSRDRDPAALEVFRRDLRVAKGLNVRWILFESYPADFAYGDYLEPWNKDNFRAMVDLAHDAGFKVLPYTNATEVDVKSSVYRLHKDWLARPPIGTEYPAFASCFLPEYFKEGDFFNKLVCPAGPWRKYYLDQCDALMETYGFDGIYVDRIDYRVPCLAHPGFSAAIPPMMEELRQRIKKHGPDKILVINDSCKIPDRVFKQAMQWADVILTETLPPGAIQELTNWATFATSPLLHRIKPVTEFAVANLYKAWAGTSAGDDGARIARRVRMLRRITGKPIWVFTHAISAKGANAAKQAAMDTGQNLCIFSPKPLARSESILSLLSE